MPQSAAGDIFMACPAEGCRYCSVVTVQKQDRDTAECHQVTIIHRHYLQGLVLGHYNALSLMTWTTCET